MAGFKRKRDSSSEKGKKDKPVSSGDSSSESRSKPANSSILQLDNETSFPRGGASVLTPLEYKEVVNEAKRDALFTESKAKPEKKQTKQAARSKSKLSKKSKKTANADDDDEGSVPISHFSYKSVVEGTIVFGRISEINTLDLAVSLPNCLTGYVPITSISDSLSERLDKLDEVDEDNKSVAQESFPDLLDFYTVGQWVRARVTSITNDSSSKKKKRIELSLRPQDVNGGLGADGFVKGSVIQTVVTSWEDHGIAMDLGIEDFTGFLPLGAYNPETEFMEGQTVLCTVTSKKDRVFQLAMHQASPKALDKFPSVQAILPGNLANVLITDVLENGVTGKLMGVLNVTSDLMHSSLSQNERLANEFTIAKTRPARILYTIPSSPPTVAVTFLPHAVDFNKTSAEQENPLEKLPLGFTVEEAKVSAVSPSLGIFCDVGVEGVRGFAHISRLSDSRVDKVDPSSGDYQLHSTHKARITGFSFVDNLFVLSLQESIIDQPFLRVDDIPVGKVIKGSVVRLFAQGVIVKLSEGINGLVPTAHMADVQLHFPERKFKEGLPVKCRVLAVDSDRKRVLLTLKKSLLNSDLPIIDSYESVQPGAKAVGVFARILNTGAVVEFYNHVRGFLPTAEMSEAYIQDARDHFKVGQTVSVTVVNCDPETRKMRLSCREQNWTNERSQRFTDLEVGSVVSGAVSQKTENSVIVDLGNSVNGVIQVGHLSDGDAKKCQKILSKIRATTKLSEVLVLRKDLEKRIVFLTLKQSLIDAAKAGMLPKTLSDLKEGVKYAGFVKNITEFGVFIEFANGVTALAPKAYLSENYVPLPAALFKPFQSLTCVCFSIDMEKERALVSLKPLDKVNEKVDEITESKYVVIEPVDESITKAYDYTTGKLTWGVISSVKATQLNIDLAKNVHGRVDVSEAFDNFEDISDPSKPFSTFKKGDKIQVRVLGTHDAKNHKFLPISHRVSPRQFLELSIKPSVMKQTEFSGEALTFKKGDTCIAFVNNTTPECIWVSVGSNLRGRIAALDASNDLETLNSITEKFPVGSAIQCTVLSSGEILTLSAMEHVVDYETISAGDKLLGRISNINDMGMIVQLPGALSGRVSRTDVSDDFETSPNSLFSRNQFVRVYVLSVDVPNRKIALSTRASHFEEGKEIKDPEIKSFEDVEMNRVYRGFVTNVADTGLFVTLGRNVVGRVKIAELFDSFIKEWKPHFQVSQLVKAKVVHVDQEKKRIELSLKPSRVSSKEASAKEFSEIEVGSNVDGTVIRCEDFGVLIRLDGTDNIVGLCHKSEIADTTVNDVTKLYSAGDKVRAHVLSVDPEKRRVALGLKSSYFDADSDVDMYESGAEEDLESSADEEEDSDEAMDESAEEEVNSDSESESSDEEKEDAKGLEAAGFDWKADSTVFDKEASADSSDEDSDAEDGPQRKKKKNVKDDDEERDLDDAPQGPADFERKLLSEPNSSLLWIGYMAYHLGLNEIDKSREIGQRALKAINFREEEEKLNVWVALLNLEVAYGNEETLDKTFKEACHFYDELVVYERLCGILIKQQRLDLAKEYMERMVKRFSQIASVWLNYATFLMSNDDAEAARGLLQRSLQSLPKKDHVSTIEKFALLEFKQGDPERGRTIFEGLLSNYPKRLDLWNVLLDMEIKQGDVSIVRRLFQRLLANKLSLKKAKFVFKKWLLFEKDHGTPEGVEDVKQRAAEYVEQHQSDE
ncbi:U3 snoRNP-associated protein Rrp5 [Schizosaccharomyces japonicus yFS275]|uniref:rRNA biogenesis protein RRP5 n=1 Tax=Schizosaccharomyces japonicus (strain yFS275 / FY16936) TaxID=402676 RepID=B6K2R4_SCHJY|nr:U3 snoRNP-associated protein Rrp5 [Schizosaccharomyces japonicus yFS275]EEB07445.1 U3 snoRNP-associated protein Rrp5 [Schizosaccharomyces japonicus yFS275]